MPVGTAATVKAMHPHEVRALGADVVLGNVYHLMLRPGAERVAALGGLHRFMHWPHPILTDSGGFQVMSLAKLRKLDESGVTFQSHLDGSTHVLTPERSIEIQGLLGSDIQMQFDECMRLPASEAEVERAMRLSLRWAERSKAAFGTQPERALFGIVQGGTTPALRARAPEALVAMDFDGYAIGGLAVGEPQEAMLATLEATVPFLPADKPRYLMGVGTPDDLLESVARGIDMFDCVMPTRAGRHGQVYHAARPAQPAQRPPRRRSRAGRSAGVLRRRARLFAGLPPPSRQVGRDPRHDAADGDQHRLLPGPDARHAPGGRRTPLRGFPAGDQTRLVPRHRHRLARAASEFAAVSLCTC